MIKEKVKDSKITLTESNDPRSYRQNSDKLLKTGFEQKYSVSDAIEDLIKKYNDGLLVESDNLYTVKWMKHLRLDQSG